MLSGIKIIPRDKVNSSSRKEVSELDYSPGKRKKSKSKKKKHDKKMNKRKSSYSSDDDDDIMSQSTSDSYSESEEELSRKKKSKTKRSSLSYDEDSLSSDEGKKKKRAKEKNQAVKEEIGEKSHRDKELLRKEMGLDWMLKSSDGMARKPADLDHVHEEVVTEERKQERSCPGGEGKRIKYRNLEQKIDVCWFPEEAPDTAQNSSKLFASSVVGDGGASWRLKALKPLGIFGQLAASVASRRVAHTHAHQHAIKDRRRGITEKPEKIEHDQMKGQNTEARIGHRDYLQDVSSRHPEMRKPKPDSNGWRKRKTSVLGDNTVVSDALSALNKFSNDGSFLDTITVQQGRGPGNSVKDVSEIRTEEAVPSKTITSEKEHSVAVHGLSANQLAAKAMQLRLKGNHEEAEKLLKEAESMSCNRDSKAKPIVQETKGNTSRYDERKASSHLKKREDDGDLNLAQRIMRDRKYSVSGRADDEYDFDEAPTRKHKKKREGAAEEKHSIGKRILTQQERCQFCFENPSQPKHLVISIANFTYMMLPRYQPLVQGHCCILPLQHEASTRTVDDNVWEEMRNFKKCLIMMFAKQDKSVVFLETVIGLSKQRRHCLVECVPLPSELAAEAPMYFKKDEWSQHNAKRLIETTSEKGLKRFGLDRGFVHVIDDEGSFNSNIGLNVIRGMLQLPEEDMYRRRRQEAVETQRSAVAAFAREWEPFDWTKQLS
ncbi:unnamed protein product [Spirodela intermedia]|uniref:Uncharacterized protein n=1 Tax=Spirodela intermedia TaxID=51605 RepID=A0A7I8IY97_SPIIN|nr:unnamed protein product [Spirodela intermedia]CAA6662838.1 unnamed protein product [Spirodela intermedia]